MAKSMTAKVCRHVADNYDTSTHIGQIWIKSDGGTLHLFKSGQHITKRHYGNPYWVEADVHVVKIGKDNYELPTKAIV